jgi:hypothetical protein
MVFKLGGECLRRVLLIVQNVMVVHLENQRHLASKIPGAGFEKTERRRIGVTSGVIAAIPTENFAHA